MEQFIGLIEIVDQYIHIFRDPLLLYTRRLFKKWDRVLQIMTNVSRAADMADCKFIQNSFIKSDFLFFSFILSNVARHFSILLVLIQTQPNPYVVRDASEICCDITTKKQIVKTLHARQKGC